MKIKTAIKGKKTLLGLALLVCLIGLLVAVGVHGIQAGSMIPMNDSDQRDLGFFVSVYYLMSAVAFMIATPLSILLTIQLTYLVKDARSKSAIS